MPGSPTKHLTDDMNRAFIVSSVAIIVGCTAQWLVSDEHGTARGAFFAMCVALQIQQLSKALRLRKQLRTIAPEP